MAPSEITPPYSVEAESAVLGSILKDNSCLDSLIGLIHDQADFYIPKHQIIYQAMLDLYERMDPCDLTTVAALLHSHGDLEKVGGHVYLVDLVDQVCSTANVAVHGRIVADHAKRRRFIAICNESTRSAYAFDLDTNALINEHEGAVLALSGESPTKPVPLGSLIQPHVDKIINSSSTEGRYFETRIADLNRRLVGLFRGEMCIIAGPPSMGKTMMGLDFAVYNSARGKKALYFSIDQTAESLIERLITGASGITKQQMYAKNRDARTEEAICIVAGQIALGLANLYIYDRRPLSATDIFAHARRMQREAGLDIIVVDYIQQVSPHRRADTRTLEVADTLSVLKTTAKELDVSMVVLSQLNREYGNLTVDPDKDIWGLPQLESLRDSGALEQEANVVLFPWVPVEILRKRYGDQSVTFKELLNRRPELEYKAFIVIAKNKDGERGTVDCARQAQRMRFVSLEERTEF